MFFIPCDTIPPKIDTCVKWVIPAEIIDKQNKKYWIYIVKKCDGVIIRSTDARYEKYIDPKSSITK